MSGKLFIHCPICSTENHVPADADKIIDCGACGAPVCNTKRPLNDNDIKDYQFRLEKWGKEKQIVPQAVIARHNSQIEQRRKEQSESTRLQDEIAKLKSEVDLWKTKAASLKQGATSHTNEIEKLKADIASAKDNYYQLQSANQKLAAELFTLAKDVESGAQQAEHCLRNIASEGLATFKAANVSFNQPIQARIDGLISEVSADRDSYSWKESHTETVENESILDQREAIAHSSLTSQPLEESRQFQPNEEAASSSGQNVLSSENRVSGDSVVQGQPIPTWLSEYNTLGSPPAAKKFKERYQAKKLTVPQDSLEHQRIAPDSGAPIFIEGEGIGSYWGIQSSSTQACFLLLDKERFRFNNVNCESITVCYDFNGHSKDQFKHFKVSDYILDSYKIVRSAQIIALSEQGQWKLSSRGAIEFERKPQP